ncbi:MAG: dTMP kinase [Clostridia bacterium]|nr:dTMP kinase [Clostridia bacterium]
MLTRGAFITLEGPDGGGKTTQAGLLARRLAAEGYDVVRTHEPGGTGIGQRIRDIILDTGSSGMCGTAEFLLYAADRAQDVAEVILPALARGQVVIAERFVDSSLAYQGYGLGMDIESVTVVNSIATGGLKPDLTVLLDVDPRIGVERVTGCRDADRIEARKIEFHGAVRAAYLSLASREPERFRVVCVARRRVDEVHEEIYASVARFLEDRAREVRPDANL